MKTIRLFLASSFEMKDDREQFEIAVARTKERWEAHGVDVVLDIWEKLSQHMSFTRSQDEYNKVIGKADIFVLLVQHKVGKYSEEEFDCAHALFLQKQKPEVFAFFKTPEKEVEKSVETFRSKLDRLEYFPPSYDTFEGLWHQIYPELERLRDANKPQREGAGNLEGFRQELFQMLDEKGFEATPDVFIKIEKSGFDYTRSTLANLKTQANTPLTQLAPQGFLVGLRGFILSITAK